MDSNVEKTKLYISAESFCLLIAHVVVFSMVFDLDQLPLGVDGYFHYTFASMLSLQNPAPGIEALPFTILGESGPDHHWLIHWLQKLVIIPFQGQPSGIAASTIIWAALVPAALSAILRIGAVPFAPVLATIAVWSMFILPDRLLMFRAQNAAIIMTIVITLFMVNRRYLLLTASVFVFNHAYQGVVLIGAAGLAYLVANFISHREIDLKVVIYSLAGFTLSLLSSPWFPDNVSYFVTVMFGRLFSPFDDVDLMGIEWLLLNRKTLLEFGLVAHICVSISIIAIIVLRKSTAPAQHIHRLITFTLLSIILLALYSRHWRMGEFYGPIAVLTFGYAMALIRPIHRAIAMICVTAISALAVAHQLYSSPERNMIAFEPAKFCEHLQAHALENSTVFNLGWSVFPALYQCAPQLRYVSGLDGILLMMGDATVFESWYLMRENAIEQLDREKIESIFIATNTQFVLVNRGHEGSHAWLLENIRGTTYIPINNQGSLIAIDLTLLSELRDQRRQN